MESTSSLHAEAARLLSLANALASEANADVYLYNASIKRPLDDELLAACEKRNRRPNVILILVTEGGDPDAAYRIARCFQDSYEKFTCLIAGYCKSAGTLVAAGANELVVGQQAELGPLDVQMSKRDELWEMQSGLTVTAAMTALYQSSFEAFEHFFLNIKRKSKGSVTLKTATEIAAKLTAGLFTPAYQQIDPMYVGEAHRAQAIAQQYGLRLASIGGNLSQRSLDLLITGYPTHGFVIDRIEAEALFEAVRSPNATELALLNELESLATCPNDDTHKANYFLSTEVHSTTRTSDDDGKSTENPEDSPTGGPDEQASSPPGGDSERAHEGRATVESSREEIHRYQ